MTRAVLEDAAVAAAKAWSHAEVEPRHVVYAICRILQARPDVKPKLAAARAALEPHGSSIGTPVFNTAARALIDRCTSEDAAAAAALSSLPDVPAAPVAAPEAALAAAETSTAIEPDAARSDARAVPVAREDTQAVLAELDGLVGLQSVKDRVRQIIAVIRANLERGKAGMPGVNPGLHLVFTGPPGTGKTTVARLVARLYSSTGALPGSKLMEVTRSDLIAGFVGQTAIKTQEVINRTRPGVLFIDEAYALAVTHHADFAGECVSTLVKNMEDHRGELAVIAAGYREPMAEFIQSNPGLRSRFKTFIDFPDYRPAELVEIFAGFAQAAKMRLADGVLEKAGRIFREAGSTPDFGNARFVRSLWEQAFANMAVRASLDGTVELSEVCEIVPDDLQADPGKWSKRARRIGFF
jgi:Holliday junction resolvasome RuvABC ATP-dependent DNA helicase subunit